MAHPTSHSDKSRARIVPTPVRVRAPFSLDLLDEYKQMALTSEFILRYRNSDMSFVRERVYPAGSFISVLTKYLYKLSFYTRHVVRVPFEGPMYIELLFKLGDIETVFFTDKLCVQVR